MARAGRVKPWGVFTDSGGYWFDTIPLDGGRLAVVVGDVPGRGVEVAVAMSELRAAVQAYAVSEGDSPGRVVGLLDRLGMERLRRAATDGPFALGDPCDRVLDSCTADLRRDDDICLLAVRP